MIYALGDLHGHYSIYEKVKAMLKPEDTVYFHGDAGDRGPDSWKCIKAIYDDPQFIYIKGNHEDLLTLYVPYLYVHFYVYSSPYIYVHSYPYLYLCVYAYVYV